MRRARLKDTLDCHDLLCKVGFAPRGLEMICVVGLDARGRGMDCTISICSERFRNSSHCQIVREAWRCFAVTK